MQVEAKFLIADAATFETIEAVLPHAMGPCRRVLLQRCVFLDGPNGELAAVNAVCRVRSEVDTNDEPGAKSPSKQSPSTVVIKEHNEVEDGSSARFVVEARMPAGAAYLDPRDVVQLVSQTAVGAAISNRFGAQLELTVVGGFDNTRKIFEWCVDPSAEPLRLHMDRTTYPFGEGYEIEVPCNSSHCVEDIIGALSQLLASFGVPDDCVQLGTRSKFQTYSEGMSRVNSNAVAHMNVEAKVMLANVTAYERVLARLISNHLSTKEQHNHFYDGAEGQLSVAGAYLRLRESDGEYSVTMKQHSEVDAGSGISWQQEDKIAADVATAILKREDAHPLIQLRTSAVGDALAHRFNVGDGRLRCIGGFSNRRSVFAWPEARGVQQGLELRVDETTYSNGTLRHEIEVANVNVPIHDVIELLQTALQSLGVDSIPSTESKFAHMIKLACP